jgi:hypothetical protein
MRCVCNSWCVRNLLVMVLRFNKSLQLADSIVSLYPHQTAQPQHQLSSLSTVNTPLLTCCLQWQRRPLFLAPNFGAERSSPQTAGDLSISNCTILNTFKLHTRRIWLCAVYTNTSNLLSIVNSILSKTHLKTWHISLPQTPWQHRRLGIATAATSSAADGNIPGAGPLLSTYIPEPWTCDAQSCLGRKVQNNPYYLFMMREEYKYMLSGIRTRA